MSDSEGYEAVTVTEQGVTVTKRFEADEFPVPAIAFEFVSDRDETVRLKLTDPVPDGVEVEDLGFHPEYGSEFWTIDQDTITFEREFAPNSEYTTVYGIRATGTDEVERFLETPTISKLDPPLADDSPEDVLDGGQDVVREVIEGDEGAIESQEQESEEDDDDVEPLDLDDPAREATAETDASESDQDATEPSAEADAPDGSLVSALAAELRSGDVDGEEVELLRDALEIAGDRGGTVTARVDRIQEDVANLRAYTDALEEFLDENGTAEQVVEDFREDLEGLTDSLAELESTVDMHDDSLGSLDDDLSSLRRSVEEIESSLDSLASEVDEVESELRDHDVTDRVDELEADLEDLRSWQNQIKQTFGGE